jgi:site-specific DNA recombinase
MKVAAYLRVSTHEQASEGYSIKAQKTRLSAYAISQGWEIVHFYVDEGISAKDMERPELQRMLKGVKEEAFDCVLVYRLDRLTRSVTDLYELIKIFEKHDIKFKSATEIYDTTTATGRLFITLVASLAQWERENLGERVKFGMEQKAREGKWVINIPPLGYDKEGNDLIINESEAAVVCEIFNLYISGNNGLAKIASNLNKRGLKSKAGKSFHDMTIKYILTNPTYTGTMRYNYRMNKDNYFEVDDVIPPIIEQSIFNQAQTILKKRSQIHPRRATSPFIFSGIAKCTKCGKSLNGKRSSSYSRKNSKSQYITYYYYCPGRSLGLCDASAMSQNFIEQKFVEYISQWDVSKEIAAAENETVKSDDGERLTNLKKEIKTIENRRSKWQYAWVNEMITDKDFKKRMNEEEEKEKMLLTELEAFQTTDTVDLNRADFLKDMRNNWSNMDTTEKKQFVQLSVKEFSVVKVNNARKPSAVEITGLKLY